MTFLIINPFTGEKNSTRIAEVCINGIIVAALSTKRNEVSSFPSFPPPINPVRHPPLTGFFSDII
jgi:hypothetical protein